MTESLHLGRIRGISVGVNWSLLPMFLLLAWSLEGTLLPSAAPGYSGWGYWLFAVLTVAGFYASLLAHELSHALMARRHGTGVKRIVLWVLGGVAELESDSPSARAELEMAAAGPAMSFAIAAVGGVAAGLLSLAGASSLLVASVSWLAAINVLLALFNLLPAFPLDGGRILRALLWRRWNDRMRATAAAAKVGKAGGFALMAVGGLEFLFGGGALSGIWLAVIGWFITVAARQQQEQVSVRSGAAEVRVADAMTADPVVVPAQATVAQVIDHYMRPHRFTSFPVVDADGRLVGLTTVRRMATLPRDRWSVTPIIAAAARPVEVVEAHPHDSLANVLGRLESSPDRRAIVVDGGRVVGILTPSDARRALSRAELFGQASDAAGQASRRGGMRWGAAGQS